MGRVCTFVRANVGQALMGNQRTRLRTRTGPASLNRLLHGLRAAARGARNRAQFHLRKPIAGAGQGPTLLGRPRAAERAGRRGFAAGQGL